MRSTDQSNNPGHVHRVLLPVIGFLMDSYLRNGIGPMESAEGRDRYRVPEARSCSSPSPISDFPPEIAVRNRCAESSRSFEMRGMRADEVDETRRGRLNDRKPIATYNFPDSAKFGNLYSTPGGAKGVIPRAGRVIRGASRRRIRRARGEKAEVAPAARWASRIDLPLQ